MRTLLFAALLGAALVEAGELPTTSIHNLDIVLVDQDGRSSHLADRRGRPLVVGMFYTSCHSACPLIVDTLLATERVLAKDGGPEIDVLLVSFDPAHDDPRALKRTADSRKLAPPVWTLARAEPGDVRKLAAALDIRYRTLEDGEINHSSALTLLDREGRIVARTEKIGGTDDVFIGELRRALAGTH
jgi:protein SCO1/2